MRLIGFHPLLLPTSVLEFLPLADMLPTWTGCVAIVVALASVSRPRCRHRLGAARSSTSNTERAVNAELDSDRVAVISADTRGLHRSNRAVLREAAERGDILLCRVTIRAIGADNLLRASIKTSTARRERCQAGRAIDRHPERITRSRLAITRCG
jgi:hypothetical protein